MVSAVLIALMAVLHLSFMYLGMIASDRPLGRKVFRKTHGSGGTPTARGARPLFLIRHF